MYQQNLVDPKILQEQLQKLMDDLELEKKAKAELIHKVKVLETEKTQIATVPKIVQKRKTDEETNHEEDSARRVEETKLINHKTVSKEPKPKHKSVQSRDFATQSNNILESKEIEIQTDCSKELKDFQIQMNSIVEVADFEVQENTKVESFDFDCQTEEIKQSNNLSIIVHKSVQSKDFDSQVYEESFIITEENKYEALERRLKRIRKKPHPRNPYRMNKISVNYLYDLKINMKEEEDLTLIKVLDQRLPIIKVIRIFNISNDSESLKTFMMNSFPISVEQFWFNFAKDNTLIDLQIDEYIPSLASAISRVTKEVYIRYCVFTKESLEEIIKSCAHIDKLHLWNCEFQKFDDLGDYESEHFETNEMDDSKSDEDYAINVHCEENKNTFDENKNAFNESKIDCISEIDENINYCFEVSTQYKLRQINFRSIIYRGHITGFFQKLIKGFSLCGLRRSIKKLKAFTCDILKLFRSNCIKQINNIKNGIQCTYFLLVHVSREFKL